VLWPVWSPSPQGCDVVDPFGAAIIGIVAGVLCIFSVEFFDNVAKIDDPVGAVSVHCMNGAWGTIAVGLFATEGGLFYGGGFAKLGIQLLGIVSVAVWVLATMFISFHGHQKDHRPARLREGGDRRPGLPRARPGQRLCRLRHQ